MFLRLKTRRLMPESGVIFSVGMEQDAVSFNAGAQVEVCVVQEQKEMAE